MIIVLASTQESLFEFDAIYLEVQATSADDACDEFRLQNSTIFLIGNASNNILIGTNGSDIMNGFGGNDIICGFGGNDTMDGGIGNDLLIGGNGSDIFIGGTGIDGCDVTINDTSVIECEIQLPEGFAIEEIAMSHFETFNTVNALLDAVNVTFDTVNVTLDAVNAALDSMQSTIDTHVTIHDEVNRINTTAAIIGTGTFILQALCSPTNESLFMGSELALITNGTDTISNDPNLQNGNLTVDTIITEVRNGIKIEVTNTNNLTGVIASALVTCADHTN